jgi:hypothetical protein
MSLELIPKQFNPLARSLPETESRLVAMENNNMTGDDIAQAIEECDMRTPAGRAEYQRLQNLLSEASGLGSYSGIE